MDVFRIGSSVKLCQEVTGIVTGIMLKENDHVQYEVSWWNGRDRKCEWLEKTEIKFLDQSQATTMTVGFK